MYKRIIKELFPYLKLKEKNLTFRKKIIIYLNIVAQAYVISWLVLQLLLPKIYNPYLKNEVFTLYTDSNISIIHNDLKTLLELIKKNPLYEKNNIDIFILNNIQLYNFLNPIEWLPNRQTYAVTQYNKVYIKLANFKEKLVYVNYNKSFSENIDAVILHESIHVLQNKKYGFFYTSFMMPYWVKEGYPIYVTNRFSKYKIEKLIKYIKNYGLKNLTIFERDRLYALMVKHAIEDLNISVDDLHNGKADYNRVLNSMLKKYNIKVKNHNEI